MTELARLSSRRQIWGRCFTERVCIDLGWPIGKVCSPEANFCVFLLIDGTRIILRIQAGDRHEDYEIANACVEAFRWGLFSLQVCLDNIDLSGTNLNSITISIDLCAGISGYGNYCTRVFKQDLRFFALSDSQRTSTGVAFVPVPEGDQFEPL